MNKTLAHLLRWAWHVLIVLDLFAMTAAHATGNLTNLAISGSTSVQSGGQILLKAFATYVDSATRQVTPAAWRLSDSAKGSISSRGELTVAHVSSDTSLTISATYSEGGVTRTASLTLTIKQAASPLSKLTLIGARGSLVAGETLNLAADGLYADSSRKRVTPSWSISDTRNATINASGLLVAGNVAANTAVSVTATYVEGGVTATARFSVLILPFVGNRAPVIESALENQSWIENQFWSYTVAQTAFSDPDSNPLTYTATTSGGGHLPSWLNFAASSRTFSGTPPTGGSDVTVRVTASDGRLATTHDFTITTPPKLTPAPGDDFVASPSTTGRLASSWGATVTGNIETPYDQDWFRVTLSSAGLGHSFNISPGTTGGPKVAYLQGLFDSSGRLIPGTGGYDSFSFLPPVSGDYFIAVSGFNTTGTYKLSMGIITGYIVEVLLQQTSPVNGASDVPPASNIVLTFDEAVQAGSGALTLTGLTTGDVRTIDVSDTSQVNFSANTVTINPHSNLNFGERYEITCAADVILGPQEISFAGLPAGMLNFSTAPAVTTEVEATGTLDNHSLAVWAHPSGSFNLYVAAWVPGGVLASTPTLYVLNHHQQWQSLSWPLAAYLSGVTANTWQLVELFDSFDARLLSGTQIFVGYGTSDTEMLEKMRYQMVYQVP